jgi:hypothetical protein
MKMKRRVQACTALLAALFVLSAGARAQIMPMKGRLEYAAAIDKWPALEIKAANGSPAYVLSLGLSRYEYRTRDVSGRPTGIELFLRRPRARQDSANLAEPRIWHGIQPFLFEGNDFTEGIEKSDYGSTRTIDIERRKLRVTVVVVQAQVQPVEDPELRERHDAEAAFDKLILDVEVDNAK